MENGPDQSPIPPNLLQKGRLVQRSLEGAQFADPLTQERLAVPEVIAAKLDEALVEGSQVQQIIHRESHPSTASDVFDLPDKATQLVDLLTGGAEDFSLDPVDFMLTARSYGLVLHSIIRDWPKPLLDKRTERLDALEWAFFWELVDRTKILAVPNDDLATDLYDVVFGGIQGGGAGRFAADVIHGLPIETKLRRDVGRGYRFFTERLLLINTVVEGNFSTPPHAEKTDYNAYNKPLNAKQYKQLNREAADLIELSHRLKEYDIAPMTVPGEAVGLPWDIAVFPPLKRDERGEATEEYAPGALAEFFFLAPDEYRDEALIQFKQGAEDPTEFQATVAGTYPKMRLRLHDNGQISYGLIAHNVPGDKAEYIFSQLDALPAFVRLRGLLIAIAFDSVAREDVVRQAGGSVATRYRELREQAPHKEPLSELLLNRYRILREAGVSRTNSRPNNWEKPTTGVIAHKRLLPEGTRRRPEAEQEARDHYEKKLGQKFDGLPEGMNFVKHYKRGTGPEDMTFRRAAFRGTSMTAKHLGSLGITRR